MKILLIEDDELLCRNIKEHLSREHWLIDTYSSGEDGLFAALSEENEYDIALIDRMLPVVDGLTIVRAMRKKQISTPIIIITGMSMLQDKIEGLDTGADDYLVQPFHLSELSARIRAIIRRPAEYQDHKRHIYHDLTLEPDKQLLSCNGSHVTLTPKESLLMCVFMEQPEVIHSRDHLMAKGWTNSEAIEPGNVDNYIYFLRKRLRVLSSVCNIKAVYGSGYMLEVSHDS